MVMQVIEEIDREIARLQEARGLLIEQPTKRGPGRPKGSGKTKLVARVQGARVMSPEGRAKIAAAQKKRWAKQRKEAKLPSAA